MRSVAQAATFWLTWARTYSPLPLSKTVLWGHPDAGNRDDVATSAGLFDARRASSVIAELSSKFGVGANRLDAFRCGMYSPVASNEAEDGRAKNRRVELVQW